MGNIGEIMRTVRKTNGLTQKELAKVMTVQQPYISLVECGHERPTPMFVKLFCLLYSVNESSIEI